MLPWLDAAFQAAAGYLVPGSAAPGGRTAVSYHVLANRGVLQIKVRCQPPSRLTVPLFDIMVQPARRAGLLERLQTRKRILPRCVTVRSPMFAGSSLVDLLTWMLQEKNSGSELGRAAAFSVETLGSAVMKETDKAMAYVSALNFGQTHDEA